MSKGNTFENDVLRLIFLKGAIAGICDGTPATGTFTHLSVSLHTGDPGEGGNQTTSEADYTGYGRVRVIRDATGWTASGATIYNVAAITFGACSAGSNTVTYFAVGTTSSGTGKILYSDALNSSLAVSSGVTPYFAASGLTITEG